VRTWQTPLIIFVDQLFRSDRPIAECPDQATRAEARLILAAALRQSTMESPDKAYLGNLVSARTGLNQADGAARVDQAVAAERQAIDATRKAVASSIDKGGLFHADYDAFERGEPRFGLSSQPGHSRAFRFRVAANLRCLSCR
jgi:hypothetical protein